MGYRPYDWERECALEALPREYPPIAGRGRGYVIGVEDPDFDYLDSHHVENFDSTTEQATDLMRRQGKDLFWDPFAVTIKLPGPGERVYLQGFPPQFKGLGPDA